MIILYCIGAYLVLGFLFSLVFILKWIHMVDEASHETSWNFKLMILPGCIVFWPVLLKKYLNAKSNRHD